ncbi:MAG: right-handed parallel beta-helix repeat-containing protein [Candidatus Brocadiia bacterium]
MKRTPKTFYAAPDGDDAAPGTQEKPLATLRAARDAARELGPDVPRRIVLQAGRFFLDEPLVLDARDSGLTVEPAPGAKVTLHGGQRISGWKRDGEKFWAAKLPGVASGKWDFRMLVVNGRFAPRARLPAEGTFTHESEFKVPWMSTTGGGWKRKPAESELTTLRYKPDDLGPWLDVANAELTVYHMWDESVVGLESIDPESHTLTFSNPAGHPPGAFGVHKYVVWNVREGMTEPGQWYLDRSAGKVVYWPLPGEEMATADVVAPTIESILRVQGTKAKPVRGVTVRGLSLSVTNTPLQAGGFGAGKFEGALHLLHSRDCRLEGLTVVNVGGQGIKGWANGDLRVARCHVHHTGACGIKLGGPGNQVADCHIHHVGVTYPSAIALWGGGREGGLRFLHNEIHDTPYTAIACGGDDHRIEGNLIYRAMQELHDGAGIYITFCKRVVLRGNFIRDIVDTGGYGASAYYLDEQAEECLVEGNLALRVKRPAHNHMARNNTLRNNVFVIKGDATLTFPQCADYTVERNVVVARGSIAITNPQAIASLAHNVFFSKTGEVVGHRLRDYRKVGAEALEPGDGFLLADPRLREFETGHVRFARDSPARELGIEPIDVSGAGPRPEEKEQ